MTDKHDDACGSQACQSPTVESRATGGVAFRIANMDCPTEEALIRSKLAGLAGVLGGNAFVTEPGMAAALGGIVFVVVVVGGIGSLGGAFLASLLIGLMQTFAVGMNVSVAPVLPYLLLVLVLVFRPRGLAGERGD